MAHGKRSAWLSNKMREYWQARPPFVGGSSRGALTKKITHRVERRARCRCGTPIPYGWESCDVCEEVSRG